MFCCTQFKHFEYELRVHGKVTMGKSLYIDLPEEQAFSAGSVLNGRVVLCLEKAKEIDKINLAFNGKSYIFVPEYEQELMKEKCSHIDSDQEQIIDLNTTIWDGCTHPTLKAGTHKFSFSIELPESLPSSFQLHSKNLHGCHIAYTLKASLVQPKKKDCTTEIPITITNELNIDDSSFSSMQCVAGKKSKSGILRYFPTNESVAMEVTTDRSGYCVGDSIAISVDVKNNTKSKVSSLEATLMRNVLHKGHCHNNYSSVIKQIDTDGSRTNMFLHIPQTSPSITNCHMVRVTYELKVKVKLANKVKVVAHIPITIGTTTHDGSTHNKSDKQDVSLTRCPSEETISSTSSSSFLLY